MPWPTRSAGQASGTRGSCNAAAQKAPYRPLVNFPPKVTVARPVNSLEGVSSRRLRRDFPDLARHYDRANKLWSGPYLAGSTGGIPLSAAKQYIELQNRPG
ncbi:transposase [Actinoplanes sp. NPDC049596]|uniref:transposase n=1 Tax=unclassified Actinoplanes TaxID=2626549 RepID=UPI00341900DB